ncbi:hypothetical protein WR25_12894 [Diploscapter pachys]|uniref:Large ribosomal subunit protein mL44 n=1 Tax=Diploscapter pachys TaxID=2018661 RepID=A0A2A2LFI9_9BILA|nr:hypothetical protein WR25_12894 [Diploscapter pachys]
MLQRQSTLIVSSGKSFVQQYRNIRNCMQKFPHKENLQNRIPLASNSMDTCHAHHDQSSKSKSSDVSHHIGHAEIDIFKKTLSDGFYRNCKKESSSESPSINFNASLIQKGRDLWNADLLSYLRFCLPNAPENLLEAVRDHLLSSSMLAHIGRLIGINKLLKNDENPLRDETIADSLYLLAATLSSERRTSFLIDYVVAQIVDIDFMEIFPLKDPYAVLVDLHKMNGAKSLEPRLLRYSENSGNPIYVMAIYKDQYELVGQNVGNRLDIAFELAARDGLLRMWGVTSD